MATQLGKFTKNLWTSILEKGEIPEIPNLKKIKSYNLSLKTLQSLASSYPGQLKKKKKKLCWV